MRLWPRTTETIGLQLLANMRVGRAYTSLELAKLAETKNPPYIAMRWLEDEGVLVSRLEEEAGSKDHPRRRLYLLPIPLNIVKAWLEQDSRRTRH